MASSPSEFLTFYRRITTAQCLRQGVVARPLAARPFSSTIVSRSNFGSDKAKTDAMPDNQHATNKGDQLDVQSSNSAHGKSDRANDAGGTATRGKDERNNVSRAKEEFPEAPDAAIGMQDERGGKGH